MSPALLLALVALAAVACASGEGPTLTITNVAQVEGGSPCSPAIRARWAADQLTNAGTIADVVRGRSLPARATVIALAVAVAESRLRNLDHGDRDSLGLFQQRPSKGWGSPAQVMNPTYAAGRFLDRLVTVPSWPSRRLGEVAETVQASAVLDGSNYDRWEPAASSLAACV